MPDRTTIVRDRQLAIRRELDRRQILIKTVAADACLSCSSVLSYFPGERNAVPHAIPMAAVNALADGNAIPLDLLSWLLPAGMAIVRVPEAIDHDELADAFRDYLAAKDKAHHPLSENGREIGLGEDARLCAKLVVVGSLAA